MVVKTLFSHNTKTIDDDAPRLSFIRQPESITLDGEHPNQVEVEVHPNHTSRGMRTFDVSNKTLWIENEDLLKSEVRLKGFANIHIEDR